VRRLRRGSFVDRAARLIPIVVVLDHLRIANPGTPGDGVSIKVMCPFQETHPPDRSGEKDMRIYSDGRAFCHMCAEGWDSVGLAARVWDVTRPLAARRLMAMQGLDVGEDDSSLVVPVTPAQLRTGAVAALGVWADRRGVDRFSESYARCLDAADQIATPDHVLKWLAAAKEFLEKADA